MDGMQAPPIPPDTGSGCHGGRDTMLAAATAAGKGEVLERLIADYPRGPHDQPQSMCPAFGSLRVGLRMRRVRDDSLWLRLLRLWADLHIALLWRAPQRGLRAVQFRDARARPAIRGYPRSGVRDGKACGL